MFRCFRCLLKPSECKDRYFIHTLYTLTQNFFDFFQKSASNAILRGVTKCTFLSGSGGSGYFRPFWASAFPLISPAFPLTLSGCFRALYEERAPARYGKESAPTTGRAVVIVVCLPLLCTRTPHHRGNTSPPQRTPPREHPNGAGGKAPHADHEFLGVNFQNANVNF